YATYATILVCSGRTAEGQQYSARARQLDPLGTVQRIDSLYQLYCARQWNVMMDEARRALDLEPKFGFAYVMLALGQLQSGDRNAALASADKALALSDGRFLMSLVAYVDAQAGRPQQALALVHTLEGLSSREFVCFFNVAAVYAALGDREKAFASLERGYRDHTG
ncbi:MAG TPA: hypothetical protein VKU62_04820, partial [Thermoanaerobaculia bacterium]|nr:hypothetical protein [Thermoanaerobaculia bacterium]